MTTITGDFKLTPEFLRDIVAKHTFHNSAAAALRELIQNAHDACIVRCAINGTSDGAVDVLLDPMEGTITVTDNGVGMTASDIQEYLTTVGRGKKGASIAEKYCIPDSRKHRLVNVVGEFGFGFIASFIIADKIEIYTRHVGTDAKSLKCAFSTSGIAYQIEELAKETPIGTKLVLHVTQQHRSRAMRPPKSQIDGSILGLDTVEAIIKKYCMLLEFPITASLQGESGGTLMNAMEFPWSDTTNLNSKVKAFYKNRNGDDALGEPLVTIPFSLSREKGDEVNIEGVLVVDKSGQALAMDEDRFGNLEVFVKRMWVCEKQRELLPHWAAFVTGILVTPDLRPLPGRDGLETLHESFDRVKRALHRIVTNKFLEISQSHARLFGVIQEERGDLLKAGLVIERDLADKEKRDFDEGELLRYVRFYRYSKKYPLGNACNLNEYLGITPQDSLDTKEKTRKIFYIPRPIPANRQREFMHLLTSQSFEVIVPEDATESMLLVAINNTFKDVSFQSIETDLLQRYAGILQGEQRDRWNLMLKFVAVLAQSHHMKSADIGAMQPDYMPVLVLSVVDESKNDSDGLDKKENQSEDVSKSAATALTATLLPHLPEQMRKIYSQTVVINTRNEAMKALLAYKEGQKLEQCDDVLADCLHECFHLALLAAMDALPPEWLKHHVEHQCGLICHYVESKTELASEQERTAKLLNELDDRRTEKEESLKRVQEQRMMQEVLAAKIAEQEAAIAGIEVNELRRVPHKPEERAAVIVLCDLVSSTRNMLGYDFAQRGEVMNRFVDAAKAKVMENGGLFDKFTGDGVMAIFGIECPLLNGLPDQGSLRKACESAWSFQSALDEVVNRLNDDVQIKSIRFKNPGVERLDLRIAVDAGAVSFGRYGGLGTSVGLPVITASRLCSERDAYIKAGRNVLVTREFANVCEPTAFEKVEYHFVPKGIERPVEIYRRRQSI